MTLEPYKTPAEIEQLVAGFESCTLSRPQWTHRAHLTIAVWYVHRHPISEAVTVIRDGILKLNSSLGIVSNLDSGYHETITRFFTGLIRYHLDNMDHGVPLLEVTNSVLAERGDKSLPLQYWSKELLMSRTARAKWVDPDLKPLEWESV
jgi:hypothetical protein